MFGSTFRTPARIDDPRLLVLDITDADERYYGWLVDDVATTRTVRPSSLEPPHVETTHVKGRLEIGDADVIWLNERTIHG